MEYSIWVVPLEPVYSSLRDTIDRLSKMYDGPLFEPHMTVLGSIPIKTDEIKKKTAQIASRI